MERSWTTHEVWFHQPSVPSTIVRRKFKILEATGGPQQRNSHWKLSKLALSPLCFKSSHISNCLATVLIVFVEVNMVAPLVAPLVAKKQLETLPIWSHSPFHSGPPGGEVTGGRWAKTTRGFNRFSHVSLGNGDPQALLKGWPPTTCKSSWVTSDLNHLQGGQFIYTLFSTFQDPKNYTKFYLMKLVGSWNCLDAPQKRSWTKKSDKIVIIIQAEIRLGTFGYSKWDIHILTRENEFWVQYQLRKHTDMWLFATWCAQVEIGQATES